MRLFHHDFSLIVYVDYCPDSLPDPLDEAFTLLFGLRLLQPPLTLERVTLAKQI
jgi:hypothetical protein